VSLFSEPQRKIAPGKELGYVRIIYADSEMCGVKIRLLSLLWSLAYTSSCLVSDECRDIGCCCCCCLSVVSDSWRRVSTTHCLLAVMRRQQTRCCTHVSCGWMTTTRDYAVCGERITYKVWLTPAAGVPCSNAANIGERKTWTSSEFCTEQNSVRLDRRAPENVYIVYQRRRRPSIVQSVVGLRTSQK